MGTGGHLGAREVWQDGSVQLTKRLSSFVMALQQRRSEEEAAALAEVEAGGMSKTSADSAQSASQIDHSSTRDRATMENIRGVLTCFNTHMSAMLDAISAEVAAARHAQRLAKLQRGGNTGGFNDTSKDAVAGVSSTQQSTRKLRFLRELAGTQMFAMHCFSAKIKVKQASSGAETNPDGAAASATSLRQTEEEMQVQQSKSSTSSTSADDFIEDFVAEAARWGMESVELLDRTQTVETSRRLPDSEATDESETSTREAGTGTEAPERHARLSRKKSLQMMV